jgi:hypothetical protein
VVQPVPVVRGARAVDTERNDDAFRGQLGDRVFIEECAVGLEGEICLGRGREGVFDPVRRLGDAFRACQEWLTAVKDYDEAFEPSMMARFLNMIWSKKGSSRLCIPRLSFVTSWTPSS